MWIGWCYFRGWEVWFMIKREHCVGQEGQWQSSVQVQRSRSSRARQPRMDAQPRQREPSLPGPAHPVWGLSGLNVGLSGLNVAHLHSWGAFFAQSAVEMLFSSRTIITDTPWSQILASVWTNSHSRLHMSLYLSFSSTLPQLVDIQLFVAVSPDPFHFCVTSFIISSFFLILFIWTLSFS